MRIRDIIDAVGFTVVHAANTDREVRSVFCCDLLSVAMSKGKEDAAWVTVMGNINTLAVLHLTDMACVVLAEGAVLDDAALAKAKEEEITVLATEAPVFETALTIHQMLL